MRTEIYDAIRMRNPMLGGVMEVLLESWCQPPMARNADGRTPWDLAQQNQPLKEFRCLLAPERRTIQRDPAGVAARRKPTASPTNWRIGTARTTGGRGVRFQAIRTRST